MSALDRGFDHLADRFALEMERVRSEVRAGLMETRNAVRITGARNHPLIPNARNANGEGRLVGWSLRETSGTAGATVLIYAGLDAGSAQEHLASITIPAGGSINQPPSSPGVSYGDGVFAAVVGTGVVAGSLYFGAVD